MRFILILAISALAAGQTTLYLRNPSSGAAVNITAMSVGTPPTLTAAAHGFVAGDRLWCDGANPPTSPLNGQVKVKTADTNTFTLTDTSDVDLVVPSGTTIYTSGFHDQMKCGKVAAYTLKDHPRGLLDGPGGTWTTQVLDPDGAGASKAPNVSAGWAPYEAITSLSSSYSSRRMSDATAYNYYIQSMPLALKWYSDRSQTAPLAAVKDWFTNIPALSNGYTGFGCPPAMKGCGLGEDNEANGYRAPFHAMAYALIQDQLTSGEKQTVVNQIFNGWNGESCTNQWQQQAGRIATTAGSNAIVGTGTDFTTLSVGQRIHIPAGTETAYVLRVTGITDASNMTVSSNVTITRTNLEWGAFSSWSAGMCGQLWFGGNHPATPRRGYATQSISAQIAANITTASTEITVTNASVFSGLSLPFYVYIADMIDPLTGKYLNPREGMKVTAITGNVLTVERGAWNTPKGSGGLNKYLTWSSTSPVSVVDTTLNLNWAKVYAAAFAGFVFASEDSRARHAAEWGFNTFYDRYWSYAKQNWSGMTSGGLGNSYGGPRFEGWTSAIALLAQNNLTPSLTLDSGEAIWKQRLAMWPYGAVNSYAPWRIQVNDAGPDQGAMSRFLQLVPQAIGLGLDDTDEFRWANYYYRQQMNGYASAELTTLNGQYNTPPAFIYDTPTRTCPGTDCVDYRAAAPLTRFDTSAADDTNNYSFGLVTSRSGWGTLDTLVWSTAIAGGTDHVGAYQAPGDYRIWRNGLLLGSGSWGPGSFGYPGESGYSGYVEIGGTNSVTSGGGAEVDRKTGSETWGAYWRTDTKPGYLASAGVQRAYRHFLHLRSTSPDYLIVYDDVATTASSLKRARLNFMSPKYAAMNLTRTGNVFTTTHSGSRLNTQVLIPSDQAATVLAASPRCNNVYGTYPCQWNSQAARMDVTGTSAEFLVVHAPSAEVTASMPTTSLLTSGSNSYAIQIEDPNMPIVAVISREQDPTALAWTSTHGTTAEVTIAGLAVSTNYVLTRDGTTLGTYGSGTGGVIHLTGVAGSYTASVSGSSLSILTTSLPGGSVGVAYSQPLVGSGGSQPYVWTLYSGSLPAGLTLSGSTISGTPTTAGSSTVTIRLTDGASDTVDQSLSITITGAVEITTTSLAAGTVGTAYSQTLAKSGGTGTFTWSISGGALPPGLSLNGSSGAITGTPTAVGASFAFTARVDATGSFDEQPLTIEIRPAGLAITTTSIPSGTEGVAYSRTLAAQGGITPYVWSRTGGTCPAGLEIAGDGTLAWASPTVTTCTVIAHVADSAAGGASQTYSLTIAEAPVSGNPTPIVRVLSVSGEYTRIGYGYPGLRASVICAIATPAQNASDTGGGAWRHAVVRLTPDTADQLIEVTCLGETGSALATSGAALSGTGTLSVNLGPSAYTHAALDYSPDQATWVSGSEVECQAGCQLVSGSIAKGAWWYRVRRRTSSADRVTSQPRQTVVE